MRNTAPIRFNHPSPISCGPNLLDIQETAKYTPRHKKEVLINANWTFIAWGFINALFFIPLLLLGKNRKNTDTVAQGRLLPNVKEFFQMGTTFALATLAWIFFRADSIGQAFSYIGRIFSKSLIAAPIGSGEKLMPVLLILVFVEWLQRNKEHGLQDLKMHPVLRWIVYVIICIACIHHYQITQRFIYFKF